MASSISETLTNIWNSIRNLFRRQRTLDDFSHDELRQEHVRLESAEQRILRDLQRLEKEKVALFEAAKNEPSQAVRQVQARKIRDINQRIESLQGNLTRIAKLLRVTDSLLAGQELGRMRAGSSDVVDSILQTDALALQDWVDDLVAGEAVTEQKVDDMIEAFQDAELMQARPVKEDDELNAILAEIEQAAAQDALREELELSEPAAPRPEAQREGDLPA